MANDVFFSFKLIDQSTCEVLELKPRMLWIGNFQWQLVKDKVYDSTPYMYVQLLRINGEQISVETLGDMYIDDYLKIQEAIEAQLKKPIT